MPMAIRPCPVQGRDRSGVCGNAIRGAGLDMVARLAAIREKLGLDFAINGVGGVVSPPTTRRTVTPARIR